MKAADIACSLLLISPGEGVPVAWDAAVQQYPSLKVDRLEPDVEPTHPRLASADVVLLHRTAWTAEHLRAARRCRAIFHLGPGAGCDLEQARELGIYVCSIADAATAGVVAEVSRVFQEFLVSGKRPGGPGAPREFRRPRLGLVGLGRLGQAIARAARERKFEVWAYDPFALEEDFAQTGARRTHQMADVLGIPDLVSVQVAPAETNRGLIGVDEIATLRRGAWLLNCGWGAAVDRRAANEASTDGRLSRVFPEGKVAEEHNAVTVDEAGAPRFTSISEQVEASTIVMSDEAIQAALELAARIARGEEPTPLLIDPPCPKWEA